LLVAGTIVIPFESLHKPEWIICLLILTAIYITINLFYHYYKACRVGPGSPKKVSNKNYKSKNEKKPLIFYPKYHNFYIHKQKLIPTNEKTLTFKFRATGNLNAILAKITSQ
jgi:hypothetical protein